MVLMACPLQAVATGALINHDISAKLEPHKRSISVVDRVTLPRPTSHLVLYLHADLVPTFFCEAGEIRILEQQQTGRSKRYELHLPEDADSLTLKYSGRIHHGLSMIGGEQSRGVVSSAGIIDARGVFLSGSSLWYPRFDGYSYLTYALELEMPAGWSAVSQADRMARSEEAGVAREYMEINKPQEEIFLIAAPFVEYGRSVSGQQGDIAAMVFLRQADEKLANSYLDATARYLDMYEKLLGPYAYGKFALVENFWESGFGMPSFTLLGSRVILLPFIIHSSYPHEILHNWWGNGVYVDFERGNWSEGLTAYLADHLIREQQGRAGEYRQQSLQKYRDYASNNRDFPLSRFRSRHNPATEAVGYGKTLMLFHMLRRKLGDEIFVRGLRQLYRQRQFKITSFGDVRAVFEQVAGISLEDFFRQWVQRTGAPVIELKKSRIERLNGHYRLHFTLSQVQPGETYDLDIPLAVSLEGMKRAKELVVTMSEPEQSFALELEAMPVRLEIDPHFDLFRVLALTETPAAFTQIFGARELLVVTPSNVPDVLKSAWQDFARDVSRMGPERVSIVADNELTNLPEDRAVVVLGWENRFTASLEQHLSRHPLRFGTTQVEINESPVALRKHAFAWVTRVPGGAGQAYPWALITADLASALPGLGRKIPHYHKYSYLAFSGEGPKNQLKGRWPVDDSPMSATFQKAAPRAQLANRVPLTE